MKPKLRTTAQAAKAVGLSRQWLQEWIRTGKVKAPPIRGRPWIAPARLWSDAEVAELRAFRKRNYRKATRPGRGRPKKGKRKGTRKRRTKGTRKRRTRRG